MRVGHEISPHTAQPHNLIILDLTEFHNKRSNTARTIKLTAMAEKTPQRPGGLKPAANRLAGKVCVVFGGTGNVGAGVAQAFAAEGAAKVVVTSRSQAKLDATRAQWGWPASVVGVVGSFGDDAEAEAAVESVWTEAGGAVDHCVVSVGFGGMTAPFSEDSADSLKTFLTTHQWPRLRATIQVSKKMLEADIPGSTLTMPSGALADGIHKFPFPGFSAAWANGVGGALYKQMCYSIACEAKDKGKQLRAHAVVIYPGVSKHGEDKQQMGMPAEPDSSVHVGQGWVAIVLDTMKTNGDSYQFGSFQNFDFTDMDEFVAEVFERKVIVVQNCGNVGKPTIGALLQRGCAVRTFTSGDAAKKHAELADMFGLEGDAAAMLRVLKRGDTADETEAFAGAGAFVCIPPSPAKAEDRANIAIAFIKQAKDAGVTHGSLLSGSNAVKPGFDFGNGEAAAARGIFGPQWSKIEAFVASEGLRLCVVRAPFFMDNSYGDVGSITSDANAFYAPVPGGVKVAVTAAKDLGLALAVGALDVRHGDKVVQVVGDFISKQEEAQLYSDKLGRKISFYTATPEQATAAMAAFGIPKWAVEGVIDLYTQVDSEEKIATRRGQFRDLTGQDPMNFSEFVDTFLLGMLKGAVDSGGESKEPAPASEDLVVAVQNCGNAGLYAIKTLVAQGGCTVRTCSRNPEKLKAGKLAGMDNVQIFKTGDEGFYKGVNRFIVIPPGTVDPDDRAKSAIEFANKCKDAGATHGSVVSVVVADNSTRRGLFGAQFGKVEDALSGFAGEGVTMCTVRAPFFLENMWGDVDSIKSHDTFYAPVDGDVRQLVTSVADVGEAVAMGALDASAHGGKAYFLLGDHITKNEVAALYSAKLGRTINFVQASEEAATAALKGFGFLQWQIDGILELNNLNDSADFVAQHAGEFKQLTGRDPVNTSQFLDTALIPMIKEPAPASEDLVVAVQNCGNAGLYAIKTLVAQGGCTVRTCSRNPEKLKAGKLAGMDNVQIFKTGDEGFYKGVNRFIVIPPGTVDPDDRAKSAIEFANKCKDAGATHGSVVSVVVADNSTRRGLFGAQFGKVEDALSGFAGEGVTMCTVRAPFFLENMWGDVDSIKSHDTFYAPVDGDVRQLVTSVADVGEAVAMGALDASAHGGKAYFLLGDHITKNEVAALYSAKLGRTINFVQASEEAATAALKGFGFLQWQIDGILELNNLNDSADFVAQHAGEFKQLTGRDPVNTSQFLDTALIPMIAPDTHTHPYTMCSICPTFTVHDWNKAKPIMDDFIAKTKTETGCIYYGWTRVDDQLKCREMYVDGAAVNAHLENVGECIGAILADGVATLDKIDIQGPADQLEIVKPGTEALGTVYYHTDGGFTNMMSVASGNEIAYNLCSIHPTFTVHDWDKAKRIMEAFIARTTTEAGCVYYGWVREGDTLKCREAYVDGEAINEHLANVGECITAILADGVASLDSINIHGPADQLEIVKPGTEALGTKYFSTDGGFSKYTHRVPEHKEEAGGNGGESKASEAVERVREPSVLPSQNPATSCQIISHTAKGHVAYSIELRGVGAPWRAKEGASTKTSEGIAVNRHFKEFQQLHHVISRQAKVNKNIDSPPRMPDRGGAAMWVYRHSKKTIERRVARFNELLTYMITTPVIKEHEAVMAFLGLEFLGGEVTAA